jgi:hypothetical protein
MVEAPERAAAMKTAEHAAARQVTVLRGRIFHSFLIESRAI